MYSLYGLQPTCLAIFMLSQELGGSGQRLAVLSKSVLKGSMSWELHVVCIFVSGCRPPKQLHILYPEIDIKFFLLHPLKKKKRALLELK